MNALRWGLAAVVASLVSFAPAHAQVVQAKIQLQPKRNLVEVPLLTPDAVEKLKFTNEQKEKYAKIEADYKDKYKAAKDIYTNSINGVRDREKIKEASEKLQADSKKAREEQLTKVETTLTAEQKTVFAQVKQQVPQAGAIGGIGVRPVPIQGGGGIGQVLPPAVQNRLQLTDEQKKEIEKIQKEVEAKVLKVLSDEQKKQLEQIKKGPAVRPIQPAPPAQPRRIQAQPAVPAVPPAQPRRE